MKKLIVLLIVLLLMAALFQVALADPDTEKIPPTGGSCHMDASYWEPGTGPGKADKFKDGDASGDRGMYQVHNREDHPQGYTKGAQNMDKIYEAHGCLP